MAFSIGNVDALDAIATRVEFERAMNEIDRFTVELAPGDGTDLQAVMKACVPGATWKYSVGLKEWTGDVVRVVARAGSLPTRIVVIGLSPLHRIRNLRVSGVWQTSMEGLVSELVKASGISVAVQYVLTSPESFVLLDEPALEVLRRLADERDLVFVTDGTTLTFRPRTASALLGDAALTWAEIQDCVLSADISEVVAGVDAYGLDYTTAVAAPYNTLSTDVAGISGGDSGPSIRQTTMRQNLRVPLDLGFSASTVSEVKARAVGELTRRAARFVEMEVVVGRVRDGEPGGKLTLSEAPWPFTGPLRIASVTHSMDGGAWTTRFGAFSDSLPAVPLL